LEYASTTWDPFKQCEIDKIEMVQRHAARFVMHDYNITSSVSSMVQSLNWELLHLRRKFARLKNFYLVYNSIGGWVDLVEYLQPPARLGRSEKICSVRVSIPRTNIGKFSFITRTAKDWNDLPEEILNSKSSSGFTNKLRNHLYHAT